MDVDSPRESGGQTLAPPAQIHLVVVPHTHWDREWYQPFQEFRSRLVRLVDRLLDLLEQDPAFAHFHFDGQTIVLEDYMEIRPQNRGRLRRLIRAGRIAVGPWYVLPDEFLVSGESIIRNLQIGHRIAAAFGGGSKVGYLPDQFGHIAQMPQILASFGIDCAVLWRGVGADVTRTLFTWEAPDGTQAFTVYLPQSGYSNGRSLPEDIEALRRRLHAVVAEQEAFRAITSLLVLSGTDHEEPQPALAARLATATRGVEGVSCEIAPLTRFIERARLEHAALQVHRGELRSPLRAHLLPGVTSMRVRQKQRDFENVSRLERYAEPLATWVDLLDGAPRLTDFTAWAWKRAVHNHPHDSICGCSVDQVHRDMEHRFDAVEMVGKRAIRQALRVLARRLDTAQTAPEGAIVVFNPNAAGAGVVRSSISLDVATKYVLRDNSLCDIPVHLEPAGAGPPQATFCVPRLTGHGFTVLALRRGTAAGVSEIETMERTIQNRFFRVSVDDHGVLSVTDRETDLTLPRCNWFVDEGDRGDEYNFDPLQDAQAVTDTADPPMVSCDATNPVVATLSVRQVYRLPRALDPDRETRSRELVDVPITTHVRLYAGIKRVDFEALIHNAAADHRLRMHVRTPLTVASAFMEQAFGVVERGLDLEPGDSVERPIGTVPQKAFTCVQDGRVGVALFNRGIPEIEVRRVPDGTEIALTLIRAVGWLSRDDLRWRRGHAGPAIETPEAQSLGPHRFEYALTTFSGDWESAGIVSQAHHFAYPPIAALTDAHPGSLAADAALLRCANAHVVVSAVTPASRHGAFVVRCYNAARQAQTAEIDFGSAARVRGVNCLERPLRIRMQRLRSGVVRLQLRPFEIVNLQVTLDAAARRRRPAPAPHIAT